MTHASLIAAPTLEARVWSLQSYLDSDDGFGARDVDIGAKLFCQF